MGYYILGKTSSISWHNLIHEAEAELKRILSKGSYQGVKPYIQADKESSQECSICRRYHGLERIHECE